MLKPKRVNKKQLKLTEGKCRICKVPAYHRLDVHRNIPGAEGGKYTDDNSVVLCTNCHRDVHGGLVVLDRYYLCTNGLRMLRIIRDGQEDFV